MPPAVSLLSSATGRTANQIPIRRAESCTPAGHGVPKRSIPHAKCVKSSCGVRNACRIWTCMIAPIDFAPGGDHEKCCVFIRT